MGAPDKASGSVALFGASPDTGNLGVSALCWSAVQALLAREPDCLITIFDFGRGLRVEVLEVDGEPRQIRRFGAAHTRRLYRPESLWQMRLAARLGGLWNPGARAIRGADLVLDASGGDSFTDLYGEWRFRSIVLPKLMVLENRRPLVLLPQTYGPFRDEAHRRTARQILAGAATAWARDGRSMQALVHLLGRDFDSARHRPGVDLAFGLKPEPPRGSLPEPLTEWLSEGAVPIVGLNVSGLLYHDPEGARERYGLHGDYRQIVLGLVRRFLDESEARLVLVPHVISPPGHYESDVGAIRGVLDDLDRHGERVIEAPSFADPAEAKWLISKMNWFCGTRMHSTIAALSSGVPAAGIAYSDKALGVFEICGQGAHVIDARSLEPEEAIERVWHSWSDRERAVRTLREHLPAVLRRTEEQADEIVALLRGSI